MRALVLGLTLLLGGCDMELPHQQEQPPPREPPADALEARLRERGDTIAAFMMPHGDLVRGELAEDAAHDYAQIMQSGWCYKIVAVSEGITDLDLRLFDPNDVLLQRDTATDDQPHIGLMRPICPAEAGNYRIEVRARAGHGQFAMQVYRSL